MTMSMSEKIADRLAKKLAKQTPYRSDFVLADFRVLDDDRKTAEVLIQYDERGFGVPTKEMVAQTLTHLYKSADGRPRLVLDMASVQMYPKQQAEACVVKVPRYRRPMEDVKRYNLQPIVAGTVFLGENMTDTWAVSRGSEGAVCIERVEEEDIDTILRERSKARAFRTTAGVSLTLNRIAASASERMYSLGDFVKCSHGGKVATAEIVGLCEGGAQVRFKNGTQATVTMASLHGLVEASEESMKGQIQALKDYYRKAYGYTDEQLNQLVTYIE